MMSSGVFVRALAVFIFSSGVCCSYLPEDRESLLPATSLANKSFYLQQQQAEEDDQPSRSHLDATGDALMGSGPQDQYQHHHNSRQHPTAPEYEMMMDPASYYAAYMSSLAYLGHQPQQSLQQGQGQGQWLPRLNADNMMLNRADWKDTVTANAYPQSSLEPALSANYQQQEPLEVESEEDSSTASAWLLEPSTSSPANKLRGEEMVWRPRYGELDLPWGGQQAGTEEDMQVAGVPVSGGGVYRSARSSYGGQNTEPLAARLYNGQLNSQDVLKKRMSKRSPACIRRCLRLQMLHPAQCNSLC